MHTLRNNVYGYRDGNTTNYLEIIVYRSQFTPNSFDSLCIRVAQVPRCKCMMRFVWTT